MTTWRLHKKVRKKTDYSDQKQYWQHIHQQNKNNQKKWKKQLYVHFKRQTSKFLQEKTWTCLRKGILKRETESPLIAAQNAIRTIWKQVQTKRKSSRCRLCGDRDETINHITSECSKFAQKENETRHKVGKVQGGNCARNWNLTIRTDSICTTQILSRKMRCTNFSGMFRYKRIT